MSKIPSPYEQYLFAIREDVVHHAFSVDGETWPLGAKSCGVLLDESTRLPTWLKDNPPSYMDPRSKPLLHELQSLVDASTHLRSDDEASPRLREILNIVLLDCATLRAVLESEDLYPARNPKESFLAIMARTPLCFGRRNIFIQDNAFVALPLHSSGEPSPLVRYMQKNIRVPMMVSVGKSITRMPSSTDKGSHESRTSDEEDAPTASSCQDLAVDEGCHGSLSHRKAASVDEDCEESVSDEDLDGSSDSAGSSSTPATEEESDGSSSEVSRKLPRRTVSEFLANCFKIDEEEVDSDEVEPEEDHRDSAALDAHVLDHSPSEPLPDVCSLPFVCMAEEASLPIVMSSILRQRQVWRISEPLIGMAFSKYATTVTFYFGWIDSDTLPGNALPQVHLGHVERLERLDMASPLSAFIVAQFLLSLEDHISKLREAAHKGQASVAMEVRQGSIRRWRLDSSMPHEGPRTIEDLRERIHVWLEGVSDKDDGTKKAEASAKKGDKVAVPSNALQSSARRSGGPPSTEDSSSATNIPNVVTPDGDGSEGMESKPCELASKPMSCSDFAGKGGAEKIDKQVMEWLFDHKAFLESTLSNETMRKKYEDIACFMWPSAWKTIEDMPIVDDCLKPLAAELLTQVELRRKDKSHNFPPAQKVPDPIVAELVSKFSEILRACLHAQEKAVSPYKISEMEWRHDFDRLFFDFVTHSINKNPGAAASNSLSENSTLHRRLERTLRMPRSCFVDIEQTKLAREIRKLRGALPQVLSPEILEPWAENERELLRLERQEFGDIIHIETRWANWWDGTTTPSACLSRLGDAPMTGTCDALATVRIPLPISHDLLNDIRLVVLPSTDKHESYESKASTLGPSLDPRLGQTAHASKAPPKQPPESHETAPHLTVPTANPPPDNSKTRPIDIMASTRCESRFLHNKSMYGIQGTKKSSKKTENPPAENEDDDSSAKRKDEDTLRESEEVSDLAEKLKNSGLDEGASNMFDTRSGPAAEQFPAEKGGFLELPLLIVEYKRISTEGDVTTAPKGMNQHRMYCTAIARFLEAVGIIKHPIYSIVGDGPVAVLASTWVDEKGLVHLCERHTNSFDISTVIGAWHYATVLCRIAKWEAEKLVQQFREQEDSLLHQLQLPVLKRKKSMQWTMADQLNFLESVGIKRKPKESTTNAAHDAKK